MDKSKQSSSVYDKIAKIYAKKFSKPSEYIDEFLSLIPRGGRVLDAGCGPGVDSSYMQHKGFEVIGVDLSKEMINLAKQKFSKVDFRMADIRKLDFPPNFFDGILASCSLIHIPKKDIIHIFKKFHQMLKSNGVVYIALQGGKSREIFVSEPFKPDEKLFLNIFSLSEIKTLLINTGFFIVKQYQREPKSKEEFNFTKLFVIAKK